MCTCEQYILYIYTAWTTSVWQSVPNCLGYYHHPTRQPQGCIMQRDKQLNDIIAQNYSHP